MIAPQSIYPAPTRLSLWARDVGNGAIETLPVDFVGLDMNGNLLLIMILADATAVDVTKDPAFLCVGATLDGVRADARARSIEKRGK